MIAIVNYCKYINYCEISINCITSKSSKLKNRDFAKFWKTMFCLKFACGMMQRQNKLCGDGNKTYANGVGMRTKSAGMGTRPMGTGWGYGQGLRGWGGNGYTTYEEWVGMRTRSVGMECDGDIVVGTEWRYRRTAVPVQLSSAQVTVLLRKRTSASADRPVTLM